jgi:hypothetical protein
MPQAIPKRRCVFCGGQPVTREHAFPLWTREHLPGHGTLQYERGEREWSNDGLVITVTRVCSTCNGGWMSRLENRAKALLADSITGRERCEWTPRAQRTIAAWTSRQR